MMSIRLNAVNVSTKKSKFLVPIKLFVYYIMEESEANILKLNHQAQPECFKKAMFFIH